MTQSSRRVADHSVLSQQVQWQHPKVVQGGIDQTHLEILDAPTANVPFSFLVMGDTDPGAGDPSVELSNFAAAFSQQFMQQLGESRFLLHTGDVTYPIGSYEKYLNGFLRPYQGLLSAMPQGPLCDATSAVFNRPLLLVPGNHDYADLSGTARVRQRVLRFVCDRLRVLLGVDLGHYGGQGGEAYARMFLDDLARLTPEKLTAHLATHYSASAHNLSDSKVRRCICYRPGQFTRLPNRYYTFRYGGVDFFALDSNTWSSAPDCEGFDRDQLSWLKGALITSWKTPNTVGRIVFFHHSAYTTEETRWQSSETLWVRRNFRAVLDEVTAELGQIKRRQEPVIDMVISGHAHCLEHVKTTNTGHADAYLDWFVCGGSGAGLRRQRKADTSDILENISRDGRSYTKAVANSQFYAGIHGNGSKKQHFHSFLRIDVQPQSPQKFRAIPHIVARGQGGWQTKRLSPLVVGNAMDLSVNAVQA